MPVLTFTADATTDAITSAGHGLVTGDGPIAVRNVGGALPGALTALTDYFFIRIDANTGKLATSNANAVAGTAVNITSNGSGTNTLEVGIPYRRGRTYAQGAQLKSSDLNAMMDALQAMHALLTGQAQSIWSASALTVPGPITAADFKHGDVTDTVLGTDFVSSTGAGVSYTNTGRVLTTSAVSLFCRLPLRTGHRIKSVTALVGGDGAVDFTAFNVKKVSISGTTTTIGSTTITNAVGGDVTIDVTDTQLGVGESILIEFTVNAALADVDNVRYTYDRP